MADIIRAVADVQRELCAIGLDEVVERIAITESWCPVDHATLALGLFHPGNRHHRIIGSISLPALNLPVINGLVGIAQWFGCDTYTRASLRRIVRHEYAHGLAHLRGLLDNTGPPWGHGTCFTAYAETDADEDLAETVALYLTTHGRMPVRHPDRWLLAKWRAARLLLHPARRARSCDAA